MQSAGQSTQTSGTRPAFASSYMAATPTQEELTPNAVASSVRVVESAVELARAEAKLLVVRARRMLVEALTLGLGVMVALTFMELTLILVALSPLFVPGRELPFRPYTLLVSIGIALGVAFGGAVVAWSAWRRFRSGGED
jgi:hypothetical protein